ncbi:MAG: pantoate--beta-alanine ligase [Candidatus Omnitrophota bacterium]|nr:pantoate--beta-alanine ligase [Candidatus Omnitrophota bacterium]
MKVVDTIPRMSALVKIFKKEGRSIGLIPTMGCLHEGHLSLVRAARKHTDVVIVSIFVNPIQFGPKEDFEKYPRDLKRDEELAASAGGDIIFNPSVREMYPPRYSTYVDVEGLTDTLCGARRPGHFKGVTTVVAKLFEIARPDIAYFGQKDAQQAIAIKKMADDLNMGIEIKIMPIIRDSDGLAMSSRNAYLSPGERSDAGILYRALQKAGEMVRSGERDAKKIVKMMQVLIRSVPGTKIDYVSVVDTAELKDVKMITGEVLIAIAVFVGKTRLIDNIIAKGAK